MSYKYIISENASVKDALIAIDGTTHKAQTLFVVDNNNKMVGTLTDGDIRRGLINGADLNTMVEVIMHRNFKFIRNNDNIAAALKDFRLRQIYFVPILDDDNHIVRVCNLIKYQNLLGMNVLTIRI